MRVVVQRVRKASVCIDQSETRSIGHGLCLFLGAGPKDEKADVEWVEAKVRKMRIFPDSEGKMNLSLEDIGGEVLLISQFTLFASTKKGNRPSFNFAAEPQRAKELYDYGVKLFQASLPNRVKTGEFASHMDIELENYGPVTIWIDSRDRE